MTAEQKPRRGRPATLTPEQRQAQLREGKVAQRARDTQAGKTRLEAVVLTESKSKLEAYKSAHGLPTLGAALDAILHDLDVDRSTFNCYD